MVWLEEYTDARAVSLPFLDSPIIPLIYLLVYITLIVFGKKYMKHRQPYDLKAILGVYNLLQVVCCVWLLSYVYRGGFQIQYIWKCIQPDTSQSTTAIYMMMASYYTWLMKGVEMIETIFFVLRKKNNQVSVLHVYHHISTYIVTWFFARSITGGMLSFSGTLNHVVHVIMYSYYFIALFGDTVQRRFIWLKRIITRIQIIQFLFLLANGAIAMNCNFPLWYMILYMIDIMILLYMFTRFYLKTYTKAKMSE